LNIVLKNKLSTTNCLCKKFPLIIKTLRDLEYIISNIYFNLTNDFEELNDDWDFITQSSSKIELKDLSGGDGGIDYLTFEKN
jgi:hypothetical protein